MEKRQWKSRLCVIAVMAVGVLPAASFAQEPRPIEANAQVGIVTGIGTHGSFGGGLGVALTPRILGYGELSYIPLGGSSFSSAGIQTGANAKAFNFNLGGRYDFSRSGSMIPYAAFGLGLLHTSSSFTSTFGGTTVSGEGSSNDLYFNVGGGLRYFVTDRWGWKPEMMIFAGSDTYVRIGGGIFYHFGR
jgi:opacity protein-like surface antigen